MAAVHAGRKLGQTSGRRKGLDFEAFIGDRDHESRLCPGEFPLERTRPQRYVSGEAARGANACRWRVLAGDGVRLERGDLSGWLLVALLHVFLSAEIAVG